MPSLGSGQAQSLDRRMQLKQLGCCSSHYGDILKSEIDLSRLTQLCDSKDERKVSRKSELMREEIPCCVPACMVYSLDETSCGFSASYAGTSLQKLIGVLLI